MKILVIGSGGREHALAWKVAQSPRTDTVYVAPGNAGTATEPGVENVPISADDIEGLLSFARDNNIDLTIVGPEQPLVAGVVDRFCEAGLRCFGPSAGAAKLEGSKAFCKEFMARHNIPTAAYQTFTEVEPALRYLQQTGAPIVVKADGLAAGKGVIVAESVEQAELAVTDMLAGNKFGDAGHRVVIEEFLQGEEASYIVIVDGEHILPLATSQDHKAVGEGDTGANTGGMGAYSPAPVVTAELERQIITQIIEPTVRGMAAAGHPFIGFLYAGVMITKDGPKTLEFNVRFGDPETQPIMMRLQSDLAELCDAAIDGRLNEIQADWDPRVCLGVVMAAGGYPDQYQTGLPIDGLDPVSPNAKAFHAGTSFQQDQVVTAGGRGTVRLRAGRRCRACPIRGLCRGRQDQLARLLFPARYWPPGNQAQLTDRRTMSIVIRPAVEADLPAIVALYNHYIETSQATFDTRPFTVQQKSAWFAMLAVGTAHQCLVAERGGALLGYSYSGPLKPKPAYDCSVETTIYLAADAVGAGIGSQLYSALLENLETQPDLHRAYGVIAQPNAASNAMHEKLGFGQIGLMSEVGFKFGRYWDVAWYERAL